MAAGTSRRYCFAGTLAVGRKMKETLVMQEQVVELAKSGPEATDGDRRRTAIQKAVILAAGSGRRMRPFTDTLPKCLVPVNGTPILVNALTHLCEAGIRETVIVVGHYKEKVYELVGDDFRDMRIIYVEAMDYDATNNMYSLWLAREHLCEDMLLLEADVFFDRQLLDKMLSQEGGNLAAVARHQPWMSGTVASVDRENNIQALLDTRHQASDFDYSKVYKTVNIYSLSDSSWRKIIERLKLYISSGKVNEYYEVVFKEMIADGSLSMEGVFFDPESWYEIDTPADIVKAERILGETDTCSETY